MLCAEHAYLKHPARHYSSQESLGAPYSRRGSALGSCDADSGASTDGDHTLDLSVSKDGDAQDLSTTSSTGNSVSDYDQHTLLMRKNLEDMANLQMQGFFPKPPSLLEAEDGSSQDTRKLHHSGLLSALNQLDTARKSTSQSAIDYSRYVKRYSSSLECGSSYCKDLGYREHFHCMDCTARVFCKKEEMIRHFKWHKKRDESLAHGFMRYSPLDDCGDRYSDCPHNRSQTHYHCIQDGCDKVYISTSDVQMHANYHRKDSAILQEGFQRFRATETCSAIHCAFQGQRTTHFHCRRPGCTFTFKNKADMEKHKTYHIKDEQLARDGFKKYMKNEPCPYSECRFSRTCNHIHCIRPRCNYVLHSSSQLFSHKRKHERKDHEMGFGLASTVMQSAFLQQQGGVEGTLKRSSSPGSNGLFPSEVEENSLSSLHAYAASAQDLQTDALLPHSNLNQMVLEDIFVKYVETFAGGREPEDKCRKCSAFNKHYHCVANNCKMAHSCQNTMMKHALEHEQQKQVTEAFFITYNKNNPCSGSACNHIRDIAHYHCNWENCGAVILASDDEPLKRLEHHRQHAILSPLSPSVMSRLGPNLASQMSAQLHPNIAAQLGQTMAAMPHTFAPTLQAHLAISQHGGQPVNHPVSQSSSLDEMFSRKRGRPPKNRVVEVWTDNVTPQAIFTSFKLPKSSQPPLVHSPSISTIDDISLQRIKFDNFEVYTAGEACSYSHPHCPIQLSKLHLHCCHCNYAGESHILLEAHARESHAIGILLEGYQYYNSHEQCKVVQCCKNQLRSHFHCIQVPSCRMVVNQYSALAAHKHDPKVADMEMQEMKVEEAKDYSVVREVKSETKHEEVATNFSMKTEVLDKDSPDTSLSPASVSVVKATGTFYPSSHLNKNLAPSPSHQPDGSPRTESRDVKPNFTPTIPPSCHDNHCVLNKKTGHSALNLHYHCPHCSQPYVDLKLLYGHMVKKHSMDSGALGLAATKETLEREYPEISILPSTASASTSPTVRQQNPAEQVHAVQSLLLQQYLSASTAQQQSVKKTSLQEQLKFQQQYNASLATSLTPSHLAHIAFLTQGGSPFPLYPSMLYPPELILEQSLLAGPGQSAPDKEAEAIIKKTHTRTGPHMRVLKDEPIPEGYLRFRFNEDCEYPHCGYREHQTHFHCTRKDCGYSFCDKTRFVQHTARHERLDTLMGGDFQQYRANVYCNRQDCLHASNFGSGQNKASHFHCLKCDFVCTDTNKVVAHRRQHQKMDSIQAAGFEKYPPSKGCGYEPQCIHSRKQTHYHCLQCGFAVLGLSQMTSHKYRHQEANQGAGTSRIS